MSRRILIAYATRAGSTAGIAEAVVEVIRDAGYDADLSLIKSDLVPDAYDAVIPGIRSIWAACVRWRSMYASIRLL
ncbi:MAG: Flavodoxin-like protein [Methanomicrobiales archaeon 53_19]|jgi:menaquinone-dependent protoporphyrinogen oxidase|uniref:hypothetical protein n=1 Tax=Methanocalculus sp. TaxID=2004547 RepID=UPI00074A0004|nr:hypothetical protein [Methanocalculus sp.]KUK70790.1 MAG: Flavodoxin-like protein [Methanocalculus sp. 52_23]KUL04603.1 MAG: Flavodoxin-like protein [Methanomicrobiales archaeon 53_19]HIJ06824.1 hypothetical protein [Methanocalculus sp.]